MQKTAAFELGFRTEMERLYKQADSTFGHELLSTLLHTAIPGLQPAMTLGGTLGALNSRDLSDEELEDLKNRKNWKNYIPGVGSYRLAQRAGALPTKIRDRAKELGIKKVRPTRHDATEMVGALVNPLNLVGGDLIGTIAGIVGKHRTLDEQVEHDSKNQSLKNILIPGYAAYNQAKRIGASRDIMEKKKDKPSKSDNKDKKEEKKEDKKD